MKIDLDGCSATPLAPYLKALAIFRIVSEQLDGSVRGFWEDGHFALTSTHVTKDTLVDFMLTRYKPAPIANPWNGGSGFYPKDVGPRAVMETIRTATTDRLQPYQDALRDIDVILREMRLTEKPDPKKQKPLLLVACRNRLSDDVVRWMDAAVLMTSEEPKWPPLLGVGGNDGRLDFSANYMKHVMTIMDGHGRPSQEAERWLTSALFGHAVSGLSDGAIGQFNPGLAGGPNTNTGFDGASRVNPWDFILAMEGALTFAAAGTHRFGTQRERVSYPFTVQTVAAGHGGLADADEEGERTAEMWLPTWPAPATFAEIRRIFEEGRVEAFRRRAEDALDFAAACASFGVDRGISAFHRYAFLKRAGKSYFAVPVGQVTVQPRSQVNLLADIREWIRGARRFAAGKESSIQFKRALRQVEDAAFALSQSNRPASVNQLLERLGSMEQIVGASKAARSKLPPLSLSDQWVTKAEATWAFRIALAVATLGPNGIRQNISPLVQPNDSKRWQWAAEPGPDVVWSGPSLATRLMALLKRRMLSTSADNGSVRRDPVSSSVYPVTNHDVARFWHDRTHDEEIDRLVRGLALVNFRGHVNVSAGSSRTATFIPGGFAACKLLFVDNTRLQELLGDPNLRIPRVPAVLALLEAKRVDEAVKMSGDRLRHSGVPILFPGLSSAGLDPERLAASLLFPIDSPSISVLLRILGIVPKNKGADIHVI